MRSALQSAEFNYQDRMRGLGFRSIINFFTKIFLPWLDNEILNAAPSNRSQPVADGRNIIDIYVKIPELLDRLYKTGIHFGEQEYVAMKELLQLQKRAFACPIVFKTRAIADLTFLPQDVPSLLQNVDPQWISYVALTASSPWSVANIDELGRVLSACNNLDFIHLRQLPNAETPEDMASAISRLLGHHSQLQALGLGGFPLGEMMERYPLPPVTELCLYDCDLTDADWKFMTSRSDLALRELIVSSTLPSPPSSSLYDFIFKQAMSLESLSLKYLALIPDEICDLMTSIAKFNTLQYLHVSYSNVDLVNTLNILLTFMPIASAEKLRLEAQDEMPNPEMVMDYLLVQMKTFCSLNRRVPICLEIIDHRTQLDQRQLHVMTPWSD